VTGTIVNDGAMDNLGFINARLTAKAAMANKPAVVAICIPDRGRKNGQQRSAYERAQKSDGGREII